MPYLIGTDEAGYGPNFGPLVIGTSVWRVPDGGAPEELYAALKNGVCATRRNDRDRRLQIADSKALYSPDKGLAELERSVLAAVRTARRHQPGVNADGWSLWQHLDSTAAAVETDSLWPSLPREPLPLACSKAALDSGAELFSAALAEADIQLEAVLCRTVFPAQFNELVAAYGSKGEALSRLTLELAATAQGDLPPAPTTILCDRHGGRTRYAALLQTCFSDHFIEVRQESTASSHYRWGPEDCRSVARFHVGGEAYLPIALASMVAKYIRELAMRAFNDFWCAKVPNLRPTAGYPSDAHRFKAEIAATQSRLGIADHVLWRNR